MNYFGCIDHDSKGQVKGPEKRKTRVPCVSRVKKEPIPCTSMMYLYSYTDTVCRRSWVYKVVRVQALTRTMKDNKTMCF